MRRCVCLALAALLLLVTGCSRDGGSGMFDGKSGQRADAGPARSPAPAPAAAPQRQAASAATPRTGAFTTRPGAVFKNSYGNTLTVANVWGHYVEFRDQNGNDYLSYALLFTPDTKLRGNEHVMQAVDNLWPLEAGKTASAWVYNAEWAWKLSWHVVGSETVQVPAGKFDTWIVEHTEESLQGGYVGKTRSWYAPSIGWNVRYRSWQEFPYSSKKPEQWELTAAPAARAPASASAR
jgi:hypothetical protein